LEPILSTVVIDAYRLIAGWSLVRLSQPDCRVVDSDQAQA
jgi:hypothetical protein